MSRTARLALNTASNAARLVVATGVWIVLTPVMLRGLGVAEYGTWQFAGSVLGLFQLLDAGFGVGVIRAVGHAAGDQDTDRRNRMLSTYLVAYLVMGLIAAVGLGLFGLFFPRLFSLPAALGGRAQLVLWLLGLRVVVLALPLSLYRGVLIGEQRLGLVNLIQTISQIAYGALFVLALQRDAGIVALAAISLATMLAEHAVYAVLAFRLTPGLRVSPALAHFSLLRQTMSLSAAQLLIALSGLILLRTDPLIVQLFVGLSGVAAYTIALRVAEQAFLGIKQFVNALSPVVAQLHGTGDEGMQRVILLSGTKLAMVPAALLGGLTIALGRPALELWVGPDVATIAPVMSGWPNSSSNGDDCAGARDDADGAAGNRVQPVLLHGPARATGPGGGGRRAGEPWRHHRARAEAGTARHRAGHTDGHAGRGCVLGARRRLPRLLRALRRLHPSRAAAAAGADRPAGGRHVDARARAAARVAA